MQFELQCSDHVQSTKTHDLIIKTHFLGFCCVWQVKCWLCRLFHFSARYSNYVVKQKKWPRATVREESTCSLSENITSWLLSLTEERWTLLLTDAVQHTWVTEKRHEKQRVCVSHFIWQSFHRSSVTLRSSCETRRDEMLVWSKLWQTLFHRKF